MSQIQRYRFWQNSFGAGLNVTAHEEGEYVLYSEVEALQRENAGLRSEIKTLEFEKKRIIQIGEAQIAKLKAPVSDEELTPHCLGKKYFLTEVFDKVIASRATQSTENER